MVSLTCDQTVFTFTVCCAFDFFNTFVYIVMNREFAIKTEKRGSTINKCLWAVHFNSAQFGSSVTGYPVQPVLLVTVLT